MKKLIIFAAILTVISSCNNKKEAHIPYNDTTDWACLFPTDIYTFNQSGRWLKKVVFKGYIKDKSDTADDGTVTTHQHWGSDSLYLLPTLDSNLPVIDSTGHIVKDVKGLPMHYYSFRSPIFLPRNIVTPLYKIPAEYLPSLYSSIPTLSKPIIEYITPDTAHKILDSLRRTKTVIQAHAK